MPDDQPRVPVPLNATVMLPIPITPAEALLLAVTRHRDDRYAEAGAIYEAILAVDPEYADALHFAGVLAYHQGRQDDSLRLIERARALIPEHPDVHVNLGNVYRSAGRLEEACDCYKRAIELNPEEASAYYNNLGATLRVMDRCPQAEEALERSLELSPDNAAALQNLGNVYRQQKRYREAVGVYRRAIAKHPYDFDSYRHLAFTMYALDERDEAIQLLHQWLELQPSNPTARHLLAAYTGDGVPEQATQDYVRETFAGFAASFDRVLEGLQYRAPQLIADAVATVLGPPPSEPRLDVIDAGCGTGLCGVLLKPYARRLIGVDLSPEMLAHARAREIYNALDEAELTAYLAALTEPRDLLVSADTLCYIGRLEPVFAAAAHALRPGGWLFFTVERSQPPEDATPFVLHVHGRYSHAEAYVRAALEAGGFRVGTLATVDLRRERDERVAGLLVAAQRI